jgi:hypothetical protein
MSVETRKNKETCPIHNRELDSHGGCIDCKGVPKKEEILADLMTRFTREAQAFQERIQWYSEQIEKTIKNKTWR